MSRPWSTARAGCGRRPATGAAYALWHSEDGDEWGPVGLPATPPVTAGEHVLAVAASDEVVVLLADDGEGGRLWVARD